MCALLFAVTGGSAALGQERFPFRIPMDDAAPGITDLSALNPAPITEKNRVGVKRGRFQDRTGRRVRFLGVNVCAGACFPPKDKAETIAARMRKLGINCVRLHHMDASWAHPNIFYIEGGSYGKATGKLDPESLDRLDFFIYQLKRHGIYVDVNLHVSRKFTGADGFPDTDRLEGHGKVVGYFEPGMIEGQKTYATQLLGHYNPYTKTVLGRDPVVALVEMTNEDSLLGSAGSIKNLPDHYLDILAEGWNDWLGRRYRNTAKLLAAWNSDAEPLGENMLANPQFLSGQEAWTLEQHSPARASFSAQDPAGATNAPPGRAASLTGLKPSSASWHLQFHHAGIDLKEGRRYTLTFAARAAQDRDIGVDARLDQPPWSFVGLQSSAQLTTQWKRFSYTFAARDVAPDHCRISFVLGGSDEDVFIADVALRPGGGGVKLGEGASLEAGAIPMPALTGSPAGRDFAAYLMDVERRYTRTMRAHIRSLKCRAPLACSQASYGGLGGISREAGLDWIDMHSYWQHPWFPNRPWDSNDYRIENSPMVANRNGGTLPGLAMHRVSGKPFTVSEYDHPFPSEYAAECVPMIFAYAAWQDWDGVFLFDYDGVDLERDRINSFFDHAGHPAKLAFLPVAARIFLGGGVAASPARQTLLMPEGLIPELVADRTEFSFWSAAENRETSGPDMLRRRTDLCFVGKGAVRVEVEENEADSVGALAWSPEPEDAAVFTASSPTVRVAVGLLGGREIALDGFRVETARSKRNFAALALASMDENPVGESESLLLTVVDKAENDKMRWNRERSYAENSWGAGPVLAETATVRVSLSTSLVMARVYALDGKGARKSEVASELAGGILTFTASPSHRTLWYEISGRR